VQKVIQRDGLLAQVQRQGSRLRQRLVAAMGSHPHVGDIRGRGLLMALEFVEDRGSKRPFDPALKLHARVKAEAMARGLLVYPMGGTVDGRLGDHVLLAPPFIVTQDEIDTIVDRLAAAVDAASASVRHSVTAPASR
jgi:adenosylmethionine-8-amino-7-oxononanoate aminotransferase